MTPPTVTAIETAAGHPASDHSKSASGWPSGRIRLNISERKILLFGLDTLAVSGGLLVMIALQGGNATTWTTLTRHPEQYLSLFVYWFFLGFALDVYSLRVSSRLIRVLPQIFKAGLIASGLYLFVPVLSPELVSPRYSLLALPATLLAFLTLGRVAYALGMVQPLFRRRVVIVGAGWSGRTIAESLVEHGADEYDLIGFVDDDPDKVSSRIEFGDGSGEARPVLGHRGDIEGIINSERVTTIVLSITHAISTELLTAITDSLEHGVEVLPMPVLYERLTGRVPIEHVGYNWSLVLPVQHPGTRAFNVLTKRVFDIVSACAGLVVLAIMTPFITLGIYLDGPGPIFYTQDRVGKGGKIFRVFKFRSMVVDAEPDGPRWAAELDDRVTRVGRFIRKTHLDEFPQFLNILRGDMSAVGPRPERPEFVDRLAEEIPFYRLRHAVKPGMAGWGLVRQGYGSSDEDALEKLQYDLYYIKNQSLFLDAVILLKTMVDTLRLGGR